MKDLQRTMSQVKDSVRKLYDVQQEKKKFDEYYNEVRKKEQLAISNFMFTNLPKEQETFEIELDEGANYYTNHTKVRVTRVRQRKITWFLDKLKKKLDKETYNKVVDKTYTINDMQGLIKYLKSCGVDPKKFKKFIDVEEQVNESRIDNMFNIGEIEKADVSGCYDIKLGEPYIRITETKL